MQFLGDREINCLGLFKAFHLWNKMATGFFYSGIMFGMRAFAPMIGFMMGAWTNSLYVDLTGRSYAVTAACMQLTTRSM
jgi:hypothetical protein